jgi:hypothetical protein
MGIKKEDNCRVLLHYPLTTSLFLGIIALVSVLGLIKYYINSKKETLYIIYINTIHSWFYK